MAHGTLNRLAKVAKTAAFAKAPKKTYMMLHPLRGAKRAIFLRGLGTYVTPGNGAKLGALVALPLAFLAARSARR